MKFGRNLIKHLSVQHIWNLFQLNNVPKLPGVDYVPKNWALAMMLKALIAIGSFLERIVVERANDGLC